MSIQTITRYSREMILCAWLALGCLPAAAQSLDAEPVDLQFNVVNATTGQPGTIERLTIDYVRERRNGLLDFEPAGSQFVAPGVPLKEGGEYLITAWYRGLPYWWSLRGHQLIGQQTTLHVFDTTGDAAGARIQGLNLVIRRQDSLLHLEYLLQVENATAPQQTIFDAQGTIELEFPAGATQVIASYSRGPEPTPVPVARSGASRVSLAAPLTPGLNRIQVKAVLDWQEDLEIPVGSSLEVVAWSVLAAPEWLEVVAAGLEAGAADVPGFTRLTGPALPAGRSLELRLRSGEQAPGPEADLFATGLPEPSNPTKAAPEAQKKRSGPPLPFLFGGALVIIVVVAAWRRRR